jgi:hypothetical protein
MVFISDKMVNICLKQHMQSPHVPTMTQAKGRLSQRSPITPNLPTDLTAWMARKTALSTLKSLEHITTGNGYA